MKVLANNMSNVEAIALKTYLESHGLTVQIVGTHNVFSQILNQVMVLVNESDFEEAQSLFAEFSDSYQ